MMGFFLCVIDGVEDEMAGDPLRGINVDAAGGAGKVLKMIAEKVCLFFFFLFFCRMDIAADIVWGGGKEQIGTITDTNAYAIVESRR